MCMKINPIKVIIRENHKEYFHLKIILVINQLSTSAFSLKSKLKHLMLHGINNQVLESQSKILKEGAPGAMKPSGLIKHMKK